MLFPELRDTHFRRVASHWNILERFNFARDVVEWLAAESDRGALVFVGSAGAIREQTFAEVAGATGRWANLLRELRVGKDDRVLVLCGKTPDWHPLLLAVLEVGAIAIPCSDLLLGRDLGRTRIAARS